MYVTFVSNCYNPFIYTPHLRAAINRVTTNHYVYFVTKNKPLKSIWYNYHRLIQRTALLSNK